MQSIVSELFNHVALLAHAVPKPAFRYRSFRTADGWKRLNFVILRLLFYRSAMKNFKSLKRERRQYFK